MDKYEGKMILVNKTEINVSVLKSPDGEPIIVVTGLTYKEWDAFPKAVRDAYIKSADDDWYYGSPYWLTKLLNAVNAYRYHNQHESGKVVDWSTPYAQMLAIADEVQKWRDED